MQQDKITELLIGVKSDVSQMHGVLYKDGLIRMVNDINVDVKTLNKTINEFFIGREASCPVYNRIEKQKQKRFAVIGLVCGFFGAIIGGVLPLIL